jgi:hypothetical protein
MVAEAFVSLYLWSTMWHHDRRWADIEIWTAFKYATTWEVQLDHQADLRTRVTQGIPARDTLYPRHTWTRFLN